MNRGRFNHEDWKEDTFMCVTILGVTVCVYKAEKQEHRLPDDWRYANPDLFLEQSRHKALLLQVTRVGR